MPKLYLALLIPVIVAGIFYFYKKHEFVWWEFFVPLGCVLVMIVIAKVTIEKTAVSFTEYWGSSVVGVYEEEPYNYWHHEMCSRSVPCGTDSKGNTQYCTEWYDCSHQDDVGPSWWAVTNIGENIGITEQLHDQLVKQFGTRKTAVDSHKNYDARDRCVRSDGTKFEGKRVGEVSYVYETKWDGSDERRKAYSSKHTYVNKVKASDLTIFNIKEVTEKQADSLGLYKYPEHDDGGWFGKSNGFEFPTILGGNVSPEIQEKFRKLNGKFGVSNELRLWILVFENKPMSIAQYQENYWVKGNKNELVVCIGKKGNEIQWAHSFSWAHSDELTVAAKNAVLDLYTYRDSSVKRSTPVPMTKEIQKKVLGKASKKLPEVLPVSQTVSDTVIKVKSSYPMLTNETWNNYYQYLNQNLNRFERRSFEEFDYLRVEPSATAVTIVFILAILISVGACLWVINNDINDDNNYGENQWRRRY